MTRQHPLPDALAAPSGWWLIPLVALLFLLLLSDPARNRECFIAANDLAAMLPDTLWADLTTLGDTLVALCLLLPLLRRRPDLVVAVLLASLPATLLSHGLKDGLAIARPYAILGDEMHVIGPYLKSGSLPSGHTTTAFVLAVALAAGFRSTAATAGIAALALLVGVSRIAVGAHWPADIAAGALCGWFSGLLGLYAGRRLDWHRRPAVLEGIRYVLIACTLYLLFVHAGDYPLARPLEQALALAVLVIHLLPGWRLTPSAGRAS